MACKMGPNATLEPSLLCWEHTCCNANGTGLCFFDYLKFSSTNEAGLLHHVAFWKGWWLLSIYTSSSCTWPLSWWEHAFAFYKVVTFAWKTHHETQLGFIITWFIQDSIKVKMFWPYSKNDPVLTLQLSLSHRCSLNPGREKGGPFSIIVKRFAQAFSPPR